MTTTQRQLQQAVELHEQGELIAADNLYREILRADPKHADVLHLLGVSLHQREFHHTAVEYINKAIQLENAPLYQSNLGTCYESLFEMDEAIACFHKAIELDSTFAEGYYNLAFAYEKQGNEELAIEHYRSAIAKNPQFFHSYLNLGKILSTKSEHENAVEIYRKGLEVAPACASLHFNLANCYRELQRTDEALMEYRRAIDCDSQVADFHNNLGSLLHEMGKSEAAQDAFCQALALDPENQEAKYNLSMIKNLNGIEITPIEILREDLNSYTDNIEARIVLAKKLVLQKRYDEAIPLYQDALAKSTDRADVAFGLGFCLYSQGKHQEAEKCYRQGLALDGSSTESQIALGTILIAQEKYVEAEKPLRTALELEPENTVALYNLGNALKDQWKLEDALECYNRALELQDDFSAALINRGVVLQHLGRIDESLVSLAAAVENSPENAEAHFHRAQVLLMQGNYSEGFREYEWRWKYEAETTSYCWPQWEGQFSLSNRTIFVYSEQGIGDEIMFASCLPQLSSMAAGCVIECDSRLVPIYKRSFPLSDIVAKPWNKNQDSSKVTEEIDCQVAVGSLPGLLRQKEEDFPQQQRYLIADPHEVQEWTARLNTMGDSLKVGISWRGGKRKSSKSRSISLENWKSLLAVENVQFVNLQYGDCTQELHELEDSTGVKICEFEKIDPLKNIDGFAAAIGALDLVISIDNSTVHLAGALGVPTFVMLPFSPNWRWQRDRQDTPWYASTKLYRQSHVGEWGDVFAAVVADFKQISTRKFPKKQFEIPAAEIDEQFSHEKSKYEKIWTHDEYRVKSFGFMNAEKVDLIDHLRRYNVKSILDAGCGSGKLMQKLITEYADEFDVHGFDISVNCLDPFFDDLKQEILSVGCLWNPEDLQKKYDGVICTDVMEHIPTDRVPAVLRNLQNCTRNLGYFSVALFPDGYGKILVNEPLHLTVESPEWWFQRFEEAGYRIVSHAVESDEHGNAMWLHAYVVPKNET